MRTIKFRGKTVNGNEWIFGTTISQGTIKRKADKWFMEVGENKWKGLQPGSLGQFTGLFDKNGKEIYEGDIVSFVIDEHHFYGIIKWGSCRACFFIGDPTHSIRLPLCGSFELKETLEVIGNIHDNPELVH